jgi:uncharacterized membrane protein
MSSERMNRTVYLVLVTGMILSFSIMIIGLVMYAITPTEGTALPLDKIAEGVMHGSPIAIIDLGIVILIATPFVRVMAAGMTFGLERDYRFVGISIFVLAMIILAVLVKL